MSQPDHKPPMENEQALQNTDTKQHSCSITFRTYDASRYETFRRFYLPLERWTQDRSGVEVVRALEETAPPRPILNTPADWLMLFLPKDLIQLNLPDATTSEKLLTQWAGMDKKARFGLANTPELQNLSDFMDLVTYINDIDFTLINCEKISADTAKLSLLTPHHPLPKRYILEELLMFFGLFSIVDSDC